MQVDHAEHNIAYMVSMMQFYHIAAASSTVPPQLSSPFQLPVCPPIVLELPTTPADDQFSDEDQPDS